MRKRFNRNAICSSENYRASKKAHIALLEEKHNSFDNAIALIAHSEQVEDIEIPRTVIIFGKPMRLNSAEYEIYKACNF